MDEIGKIQAQITTFLKARDYLLNQRPSDMVAVAEVTEKIIDLNRRLTALLAPGAQIPQLTAAQQAALQQATQELDKSIQRSAAASEILDGVAKLANS
jgi:hypothetical protein